MGIISMFSDCGCGCKGGIAKKRFMISVLSALVFYLIMNPFTFKATRGLFGPWISDSSGCPTFNGTLLHSVVYGIVIFALMLRPGSGGLPTFEKLKISVLSALLFYIISSPNLFKFVNKKVGGWVSDPKGCPTPQGSLLHTMVFLLITYAMMNGKRI